jgi:hypothetical protein
MPQLLLQIDYKKNTCDLQRIFLKVLKDISKLSYEDDVPNNIFLRYTYK